MSSATTMISPPQRTNPKRAGSWVWMSPLLGLVLVFGVLPIGHAANVDQLRRFLATKVCINCDLRQANLTNTQLSGAILRQTNLKKANLRGADLSFANLRDVNLKQADLTNANLSSAVLRNVNLDGAILTGAQLPGRKSTSPPPTPRIMTKPTMQLPTPINANPQRGNN